MDTPRASGKPGKGQLTCDDVGGRWLGTADALVAAKGAAALCPFFPGPAALPFCAGGAGCCAPALDGFCVVVVAVVMLGEAAAVASGTGFAAPDFFPASPVLATGALAFPDGFSVPAADGVEADADDAVGAFFSPAGVALPSPLAVGVEAADGPLLLVPAPRRGTLAEMKNWDRDKQWMTKGKFTSTSCSRLIEKRSGTKNMAVRNFNFSSSKLTTVPCNAEKRSNRRPASWKNGQDRRLEELPGLKERLRGGDEHS